MTNRQRIGFIVFLFIAVQAFFYLSSKKENKQVCEVKEQKESPFALSSPAELLAETAVSKGNGESKITEPETLMPTKAFKMGFKSLVSENTLDNLAVTGTIPYWISGQLILNGPAYLANINQDSNWFDGLAMLHAFNFHDGQVDYKNQFIRSKKYCETFAKNSAHKCKNVKINNANLNVAKINNKYVALSETPAPVIFDPKTLRTISTFTFNDKLPTEKIFESSNPIRDEEKKETINFLIHMGAVYSNYEIYKIKDGAFSLSLGDARREKIATISVKEPAYMHNFCITENYIILVEYPFVVKPYKFAFGGSMLDKFEWKPDLGTNFHIIDRHTKQVITLNTGPFFALHNINAYEKDDQIIIDIITFEDASIIKKMTTIFNRLNIKKYDSELASKLRRFKLNLENKTIEQETLNREYINFPRINEHYRGRNYNFFYGVGMRIKDHYDDLNELVKIGLLTGEAQFWYQEGCYPSEVVFVGAPDAQEEDDGIVMSVVLDSKKNISFLLILNAATFKEIARVELPHYIPFGLRGNFYGN